MAIYEGFPVPLARFRASTTGIHCARRRCGVQRDFCEFDAPRAVRLARSLRARSGLVTCFRVLLPTLWRAQHDKGPVLANLMLYGGIYSEASLICVWEGISIVQRPLGVCPDVVERAMCCRLPRG